MFRLPTMMVDQSRCRDASFLSLGPFLAFGLLSLDDRGSSQGHKSSEQVARHVLKGEEEGVQSQDGYREGGVVRAQVAAERRRHIALKPMKQVRCIPITLSPARDRRLGALEIQNGRHLSLFVLLALWLRTVLTLCPAVQMNLRQVLQLRGVASCNLGPLR